MENMNRLGRLVVAFGGNGDESELFAECFGKSAPTLITHNDESGRWYWVSGAAGAECGCVREVDEATARGYVEAVKDGDLSETDPAILAEYVERWDLADIMVGEE